jgi:hypothetical protein
VRSKRTRRFRELFEALPAEVQREANAAYARFRQNPRHPGLHFTQVHGAQAVYSARVGLHYRALAVRQPDHWLWFWIGTHAEYDRLLAQL